jgi:hypothetical protein
MITKEFTELLNDPVRFSCYGDAPDEYQTPLHKKIRFKYATGVLRCEYCWCIPQHKFGKCEHCGAPL